MTNPKKRGPRKPRESQCDFAVESELKMPKEILLWELDLLTSVLKTVKAARDTDSQQPAELQ